MGGEDDLCVRIEFSNQTDELLLPFYVETDFGFIHQQGIVLVVFNQHGEQDDQELLFA